MVRIIDFLNYGDQIEEWFELAALEAEYSNQVTRINQDKLSFTYLKLSAEYDYVYTWGDEETRAQYSSIQGTADEGNAAGGRLQYRRYVPSGLSAHNVEMGIFQRLAPQIKA